MIMLTRKLCYPLLLMFVSVFFSSCQLGRTAVEEIQSSAAPDGHHFQLPDMNFAVLSDIHYYDPGLGTSGDAFDAYLDKDRKMLAQSVALLDTAVTRIAGLDMDFVIVCGDLTKDGERINHLGVARKLAQLEAAGPKVYVVPGNHDISNGHAFSYSGNAEQPVATVTADEFSQIYGPFGFDEALHRDSASLSYIAQPSDGSWLMALDSCRYKENKPKEEPITAGALSDETLAWAKKMLVLAQKQQKTVLVMLHHGVVEHYPDNEKFYEEYILDNWKTASELFASHGAKLVFTGHFHAQDVTKLQLKESGQFLFDIETGSIVSWPSPFRIIRTRNGRTVTVQSRYITEIPSMKAFTQYAHQYMYDSTQKLVHTTLAGYKVSKEQRDLIAPQITRAYMAHLKGDEQKPEQVIDKKDFSLWLKIIAWVKNDLIHGWWTDLPPGDNDLTIDLVTGAVETL
jgi:3',5'-cyclic AMP phosphodiesterase CpdA